MFYSTGTTYKAASPPGTRVQARERGNGQFVGPVFAGMPATKASLFCAVLLVGACVPIEPDETSTLAMGSSESSSTAGDGDGGPFGIACFDIGPYTQCIGTIDGETVLVAAPSRFDAAVMDGAYVPIGGPACGVVGPWDGVECYEVVSQGGAVACVGELDGVLFPGADPCEPLQPPSVLVRGLPLWPADPADYGGYSPVPWPG